MVLVGAGRLCLIRSPIGSRTANAKVARDRKNKGTNTIGASSAWLPVQWMPSNPAETETTTPAKITSA
jgi:hypothetical protein